MNILLLSTYPAVRAAHGGQHRLAQIAKALRADGHSVDLRGVLGSESYNPTPGYLSFPGMDKLSAYLRNPILMEDWAIGRYAADPKNGFSKLKRLCGGRYDAVLSEQPWLFEFAHKCFAGKKRPMLIYGSQNIEHQLKYEIAESYLTTSLAEKFRELVRETEYFALSHSDLNIAVSEHDAEWMRSVSNVPVVVAANGVADRRPILADVERGNEISECRKFALYCASSHPPNVEGFYDMFSKGIGCLSPEQRLIVVGGAGATIEADPRFGCSPGLAKKFVAAGEVSESHLSGLLATAHVVLLPITRGGGTNLKTAEALWAGRHIVGTSISMRGFEHFSNASGVSIADQSAAFQTAMRKSMARPALQIDPHERQRRSRVLWTSTLKPLVEAVRRLGGKS